MNGSETNGWVLTACSVPRVGTTARRTKTMTEGDIRMFYEMTGDENPIHFNDKLAASSVFKARIVQGGLITGVFNAIVANQLPGPGSVFLHVEWDFLKPVYVGETITGSVTVTRVRTDKPICELETMVRKKDGDVCLRGNAVTFTSSLNVIARR